MQEFGFYHPDRGYWQTLSEPSQAELDTHPVGTISVPLRPDANHVWQNGAWVFVQPEPKPAPLRDIISRRQFFQQLANMEIITRTEALAAIQTGTIPTPLQTIIDSLPTDDDKFEAMMLVSGAQEFNRTHSLSETVRIALSWTVEQRDNFWKAAAKL